MGALERFPKPTSITSPGVEALSFSYDADNRITGIANGMNASQSETLGYDALGQLTGVTSTAGNASYAYDADGNRIAQTVAGASTSFTYATGSNQLVSTTGGAGLATAYGYDADGNTVTLDGKTAYQYGPFDRLTNAGGVAYTVSAAGERLAKVGNGGATYFAPGAGGQLQAEDVNGTWRDYVWLNGRLVTVIASGGVFTVASDQTGRPVALTAPNSHAVVWSAAMTPFDRSVASNAWGCFDLGYPGQYVDAETGLRHNGNRDYDPATGRYIESDPIGLAGGVNTYAYVGDDPVNGVDPTGLMCWGQFALGLLSTAGGGTEAVFGAATAITGVPTADPAAIVGGSLLTLDGAANFIDGLKAMASAVDGVPRTSEFHDVGQELGGSAGAEIGDDVSAFGSVVGVASAAADFANLGTAGNAFGLATSLAGPAHGVAPSSPGKCGCQ